MVERVRITQTEPAEHRPIHRFKRGDAKPPGSGRKPGQVNKVSLELKTAIFEAAELVGQDGRGKRGAVGYLARLAMREPQVFGRLLEKLLPYQLTGKDGGPLQGKVTYESREAVIDAMKQRGLPVPPQFLPIEDLREKQRA